MQLVFMVALFFFFMFEKYFNTDFAAFFYIFAIFLGGANDFFPTNTKKKVIYYLNTISVV